MQPELFPTESLRVGQGMARRDQIFDATAARDAAAPRLARAKRRAQTIALPGCLHCLPDRLDHLAVAQARRALAAQPPKTFTDGAAVRWWLSEKLVIWRRVVRGPGKPLQEPSSILVEEATNVVRQRNELRTTRRSVSPQAAGLLTRRLAQAGDAWQQGIVEVGEGRHRVRGGSEQQIHYPAQLGGGRRRHSLASWGVRA